MHGDYQHTDTEQMVEDESDALQPLKIEAAEKNLTEFEELRQKFTVQMILKKRS